MRVAILDDYLDTLRTLSCFELLADHEVTVFTDHVQDTDALAERLEAFDALVLIRERTTISAPLLERLGGLRLISQRSAFPHIDVDACTRLGITVCSNLHSDTPSIATAELTWGLVLAAARRIPDQVQGMREGRWQTSIGSTLEGRALGIYGYGRIGGVVARYGRAFGMDVQVWGREEPRERAARDGLRVPDSRAEFLETSDVVSLHMRLVPATRGILSLADLESMKPTAILVNTSRAGLIESGALERALRAGRPGWAAIDVYDSEPVLERSDPLVALPNVTCTPHVGYVTREEWELQFTDIFTQVNAFAEGAPINVVNPEVLAGA
jgi:D-3-phosphoglycerate dehydrogenase